MKASTRLSVRLLLLVYILIPGISSCGFPASHMQRFRTLFLPATPASVLVVIADPNSASGIRTTGALIAASARPGERVVILNARGGAILASSRAPTTPGLRMPPPPPPLPSHPTSFQRARHQQASRQYRNIVRDARALLLAKQHQQVVRWAGAMAASVAAHPGLQRANTVSISVDLGVAVSVLSSLRQAGARYGVPTVIVIIRSGMLNARPTPTPPASLQSSTVVVDDFSGTPDEEAAWQANLVQGGASRAVVLTPATCDQLAAIVRQGLDGATTDTLTSVLFGLGQYRLQAAALPQLHYLLRLLAVEFPRSTATINGYTDNLPVAGGNVLLSRRRAQAVEAWLIAHGITAGRLQAFGYGDTDPVAPNTTSGQPLNRRVVAVIDPVVSA